MALSGTFIIRPVVNTSLALDIAGDVDSRSANVYLDNFSKDDGQFWHFIPVPDGVRIVNALSGKFLDLEVTHGFESQTNVVQYDLAPESITQSWYVQPTGGTALVDGVAMPTYVIKCSHNMSLALDVQNAASHPGANVWVYDVNGSDAQRFVLFDAGVLPDGWYTVRPKQARDLCMGIYQERKDENGSPIITLAEDEGSDKVWRTVTDTGTGSMRLQNGLSGRYLRLDSEEPRAGMTLSQWDLDESTTKLFLLQDEGSAEYEGQMVPTYRMRAFNGTGYSADVAAESGRIKTEMTLEADAARESQLFEFRPTLLLGESLSAPSGYALRYPDSYWNHSIIDQGGPWGNEPSGSIDNGDGSWTTDFAISCDCPETALQMRYRLRYVDAMTGRETVGLWQNAADGSTAHNGWGYAWSENVRMLDLGRKVTPRRIPITIGNRSGQTRKVVVEVEARTFAASYGELGWPAHSRLTSGRMDVVWADTATLGDLTYTGLGLVVPLSHDYPANGVSTTLTAWLPDGSAALDHWRGERMRRTQDAIIPWRDVRMLPRAGTSVTAEWSTLTPDGARRDGRVDKVVAWKPIGGAIPRWVEPTIEIDTDSFTARVTVGRAASIDVAALREVAGGYEVVAHAKLVRSDADTATYRLIPPRGDWSCLVAEAASAAYVEAGHRWGVFDAPTMDVTAHVWNWGDGRCAVLRHARGAKPKTEVKYSADVSTHVTTGRLRPLATAGSTVTASRSVTGAISKAKATRYETKAAFAELAEAAARHERVLYRSPAGDMVEVTVSAVSVTEDNNNIEVSVSMDETEACCPRESPASLGVPPALSGGAARRGTSGGLARTPPTRGSPCATASAS